MSTVEEKRVYDGDGAITAYVAAALGVAAVSVSDGRVGEFRLVRRCDARDVAARGGRVAVATDADVLVGAVGGDSFDPLGFGPAAAVGFAGDAVLAAGRDGSLARRADDGWTEVAALPAVRAIDAPLVATAEGVYRAGDDATHAGLDDAFDVAAAGRPVAATGDGLYELGNGWLDAVGGAFRVASGDGERAHAATAETLYARRDGEWATIDLPAERVADIGYGRAVYVLAGDGTLLADAGDGWRSRAVGVREARALAVPRSG